MAILTFLIIAWLLTLFSFEQLIIQSFKELFGEIVLLLQGTYSEYFLRG